MSLKSLVFGIFVGSAAITV